MMQCYTCKMKEDSKHACRSSFKYETYRFFFRQCWIENPIVTVTKIMMMMNSPMTAVKIIPTELLRTVTDVGVSVYVVTVALSNVEMSVAKAVLKGDDVGTSVYVDTLALFT